MWPALPLAGGSQGLRAEGGERQGQEKAQPGAGVQTLRREGVRGELDNTGPRSQGNRSGSSSFQRLILKENGMGCFVLKGVCCFRSQKGCI